MQLKDLDIELALKEREDLQKGCDLGPNPQDYVVQGIASVRTWQLYVWEPNAAEAFVAFWSHRRNSKRFRELFYVGDKPRWIEGLLEPSFHYFPCEGIFLDADAIPPHQRNYWGEDILKPTTRMLGYRMVHHMGSSIILAILGSTFLKPELVTFDNWNRMQREIGKVPRRDLVRSPYVMLNNEWRTLPIRRGVPTGPKSLEWLAIAYQLRLFLEQPFVGQQRYQQQRKPATPGAEQPEALDIVKISMRQAIPVPMPNFSFPKFSRITGRPLEFEVPVKGHMRVCASGKVVPVKPHSRGPRGVQREHVIKVVR